MATGQRKCFLIVTQMCLSTSLWYWKDSNRNTGSHGPPGKTLVICECAQTLADGQPSSKVRHLSHRVAPLPETKSVILTLNIFIIKLLIGNYYHRHLSWKKISLRLLSGWLHMPQLETILKSPLVPHHGFLRCSPGDLIALRFQSLAQQSYFEIFKSIIISQ